MNEFYGNSFDLFISIWIFIIGLCIGSFLNVVALRGLSGESIVLPPSKCPKCKNKLKWWMNIPVFSYIFLRGKCHFCKEHISFQYPVVELLCGLLFLFIFLSFSYSIGSIFFMIAVSLLLVMSVCDIKESVIFDLHAYLLIGFGLLYNLLSNGLEGLWFGLFGGVVGFILYELIARLPQLFLGQRAFGEGDSLIAFGIGAFFGWKMVLVSTGISILVMSIFTFPYFFIHSYRTGKRGTCFAILASILLILLAYFVPKSNLINEMAPSLIFLFVIISGALVCAKLILSDMNKKDENGNTSLCILPFGPSMAVSFILIMFFGEPIISLIKGYFS